MFNFRHRIGHRIGSAGMVLAALVALGSGAAQAAPQALALVATKGKVALVCGARECGAEVTSFCLDAGRFSPAASGTPTSARKRASAAKFSGGKIGSSSQWRS